MNNGNFSLDSLEEITDYTPEPEEPSDEKILLALFKVRRPGYVPPSVKLRGWVSENLFTGSFSSLALHQLRQDPGVI